MKTTPRNPRKQNRETANLAGDFAITKIERSATGGRWVFGTMNGHRFEALVCHAGSRAAGQIAKGLIERLADQETVYTWSRHANVRAVDATVAAIADFLVANLAARVDASEAEAAQDTLTKIAAEHLGIETLQTRNSDRLDFHDLSVGQIAKALDAAYRAGQESLRHK